MPHFLLNRFWVFALLGSETCFEPPRSAETFQAPNVLTFVMAKDIAVPFGGKNTKKSRPRRIPPVFNERNFQAAARQDEPKRPLVSAKA
jgi:hypothetical protein